MEDQNTEPNLEDIMQQLGLGSAPPSVQQKMFSEIQNLAQKRVLDTAWDSLPQNIISKITESDHFEEQHVGFALQFVPEAAERVQGEMQQVVQDIKRQTAKAAKESTKEIKQTVEPLKDEAQQILNDIQIRKETATIEQLKQNLE